MFINILFLNKLIYFAAAYIALYLRASKDQNVRFLYLLITSYSLFNLYIKNDIKLDILTYIDVVDNDYYQIAFEPGFSAIIYFISIFFSDASDVVFCVQILLAICFATLFSDVIQNFSSTRSLDRLLWSLLSVAFILGINNNLRQCFSTIFLILLLDLLLSKRVFYKQMAVFFLLSACAVCFHRSAIAFSLYLYAYVIMDRNMPKSATLRFVIIIIGNFSLVFFLNDILQILNFTAYQDLTLSGSGRTNVEVKLIAYLVLISVLTILFRRNFKEEKSYIVNNLRFSFGFLALFIGLISGAGELASRILYFCFVLDLYLISLMLIRKKLSYAIVSGSTGVLALNSINILVY